MTIVANMTTEKTNMKTINTLIPALLGISVVLSALWSMHIAYAVDTPEVTCAPVEEQVVAVVEPEDPVPVPEAPKPIAKAVPVAPTPQPVAPPAPIAQPVAPAPVSIAAKPVPAPVVKQKAPKVVKKSRSTRAS